LKELLSVIEVQDHGEVAVSDVSTISAAQYSQKVAHQLFSACCEADESGKEQST